MTDRNEGVVHAHATSVHKHGSGAEALGAAFIRARNTTIVIGADQNDGVLRIDIDVQADVCRDVTELREQLLLIAEALEDVS